jgi:hypothetical protein
MNQHSIQRAYFNTFCDNGLLWVYSKSDGRKIRKPASSCTSESDFQSLELEQTQAKTIESPGIVALRNLLVAKTLSESEYQMASRWCALHILRNQRMRGHFGNRYETQFSEEFRKESLFSTVFFKFLNVHTCSGSNFFITSDDPVIEFSCDGHLIRFLIISPQKLIQFSSQNGGFGHVEESFENVVNAMVWSKALNHVYSHRGDVDIANLKTIAGKWDMIPRLETQKIILNPAR